MKASFSCRLPRVAHHPKKVTYERKETERQREARKQSHAYLKQQEDEEQWIELKYHSVDSSAADTIWEQVMTPGGKDITSGPPRPLDAGSHCTRCLCSVTSSVLTGRAHGATRAPKGKHNGDGASAGLTRKEYLTSLVPHRAAPAGPSTLSSHVQQVEVEEAPPPPAQVAPFLSPRPAKTPCYISSPPLLRCFRRNLALRR